MKKYPVEVLDYVECGPLEVSVLNIKVDVIGISFNIFEHQTDRLDHNDNVIYVDFVPVSGQDYYLVCQNLSFVVGCITVVGMLSYVSLFESRKLAQEYIASISSDDLPSESFKIVIVKCE